MQQAHPAAGWWGYAEANRTLVGLLVGVIVVAAFAYLIRRFWRR